MEFLKMSDGSYSPPPGINAKLTKNPNGTYTMIERSGTIYKFNSHNRIEKITDIDGNKTQFEYDLLRKLTRVFDDYGHGFIFDYTSGLLTTVTDQSSRSVSYTYDTTENLITFKDAENNDWTYTYDNQHRILTKKDPLNIVNVTNIYDGDKVARQTSPLQSGALDTSKFFISGYRNTMENGSGYQTVYNFDYKGRSISTTDPLGNSTSQEYDGENHTIASTDPCGRRSTFTYDGNNNLVETSRDSINKAIFRYDTSFNLIEKTDAMGRKDSMFYDSKRHLIKQTVYPAGNSPITTSYTYYSNGLLKTATNPKGVVTSYCYDAKGNKTSTQYGNDPAIKYEYNSYGMLNKVTDQLNATVTYTMDKRGLATQTEDALGKTTNVIYYQNGLPSQTTDRNSEQINITYTPSGKTGRIGYSDGHKAIYTYNNLDQLVSVSDSSTTATFQYDTNGRVISTTDIQGFTVANQFYPDGQLKKLIYPGNFGITYTYDTLGRLKNVQDSLANILASYNYDASGLITNIQFGNGNKTEYHYDGAGRMTDLIHGNTADTFVKLSCHTR
jgi:YD repeat-containing protein